MRKPEERGKDSTLCGSDPCEGERKGRRARYVVSDGSTILSKGRHSSPRAVECLTRMSVIGCPQ